MMRAIGRLIVAVLRVVRAWVRERVFRLPPKRRDTPTRP